MSWKRRWCPLRLLLAVGAGVLLVPSASRAQASPALGDFNADGIQDAAAVVADHGGSVIKVWISGLRAVPTLRVEQPVVRLVVADVDQDGDVDLMASTRHGVFTWLNNGRGIFTRQYPRVPRRCTPTRLARLKHELRTLLGIQAAAPLLEANCDDAASFLIPLRGRPVSPPPALHATLNVSRRSPRGPPSAESL